MKRLVVLVALLSPNCTGCLYYAYPTAIHVPELSVPNPEGSVHAFRIDIDKTERPPSEAKTQYTLSRIPIDARGLIPSQLEIAPATGVLNPFGVKDAQPEHTTYTMLVRAYRPGYQTIEVKPWEKARELQWLPAKDLLAQEEAVDVLLSDTAAPLTGSSGAGPYSSIGGRTTWWNQKDQKAPMLGLQSGSASSLHRAALQFAASEYTRLANGPLATAPTMQSMRERLQQKAIWLKRYADSAP